MIMLRKAIREKSSQNHSNSLTVAREVKNKFGQVVEKSFDFFLCLFDFVRAMKFRDSSKFSDCNQNV